ncbi:putative hydro-lyase [Salinicoccus cyprini]|uniref:Putative hydro-lyase FO441_08365 n=1 Tax=Salinicoccus cyprini TaxID=2493691 RepID=A0A558ATW2_9STAP|nr:putative hydro-lyase [Salinicoccus cyprini]TVT27710.1 putative hydro-lyase [Salinicoccus cyprini]
MEAKQLRQEIRSGAFNRTTSGAAGNNVQTNIVILPKAYAFDFLIYAMRNKKAVPVIEVMEDGMTESTHAAGSDIRTDIPKYNIYRDGVLSETVTDATGYWRPDFVTFLIGCSFTFEQAILEAGVEVKHIAQGRNVAMYKTDIATAPAGVFSGELVVSMRPFNKELVEMVSDITARFPNMHGRPVHYGDPGAIGIPDIMKPDYGEAVDIEDDEVPVFWACGVTPQNAALNARPEIMITHAPGHMFVTDMHNEDFKET